MKRPLDIWEAVILSLALHAVVILLLAVEISRSAPRVKPPPRNKPIAFKFIDQPPPKPPERPIREDAPVSDVDRQARSPDAKPGEQKSLQPKSVGNTAQLVLPKAPAAQPAPAPKPKPTPPRTPRPKVKKPAPEPSPKPAPKVPEQPQQETERPTPEQTRRNIIQKLESLETGKLFSPDAFDNRDEDFFGTPGADIAFEAKGVDWGPYAARLHRIVKRNWIIPPAAQIGTKGVVRIRFEIGKDGSIHNLEVMDESGTRSLDNAAFAAISNSHPLPPPPLPDTWHKDTVGVRWTFYYNMRPAR